jgi:dTDP-4-amino-4,6-dideoxygalactose transaminase
MDTPIYVTKSSMPPFDEYTGLIKELWDTHVLTNMGRLHKELERELRNFLNVSELQLFTNGHTALELALQASDLTGEVITTPFTFASTTHAIVRNKLTPVFCDINMKDYTMDVDQIESLITEKTSAIVPVHVYGNICNVKKIDQIAKKYSLKVIYDAAHAFGETLYGVGVGNVGNAYMFSFHATKAFNTIEGGAITYSDPILGAALYRLKNFGIMSEVVVDGVGANGKMNEFQAAMGLCNLKHFNDENQRRKALVLLYRNFLKDVPGIRIIEERSEIQYNYTYFPVLFDEKVFGKTRDEICRQLNHHNIFPRKYFYPLTSNYECYRGKYHTGYNPNAIYVANRILTLPLYSDLPAEVVEEICQLILAQKK